MNLAAISHRSTLEYIYPISRNKLNVRINVAREDLKNITLVWWFRQENTNMNLKRVTMNRYLEDAYHDYYECILDANELAAYIRYYFVIDDGKETLSFGINGFTKDEPEFNDNFFEFLWPNKSDGDESISFSKSQIYYQIFPERFMNGCNKLTPTNAEEWGSKPTRENYMGGDLVGITNRLDYIKDLGVTCLYLTPIFKATSNHKYDTIDYYDIDPSFGSKEDLRNLVNEVHKRGLKILLDGVFNHCGYYCPMFLDVVNKGEQSKYADWFFINSFPVSLKQQNYDCVGHYKWMPKINLDNNDACEYFIEVGEYWLKEFDIDGWRLDVADEIPVSFWQKFSSRIKKIKKDALLLGETWSDAYKLVNDCHMDSAMNYLFLDAVVAFLGKKTIKPSQFDHLINKMLSMYHKEITYSLYNPLDSHDTKRFFRQCNDDITYFKLAIALQMCMPGCPAIFYGDEVGLSGDDDPDCRLCMQWDENKQNKELLNWYKKLIALRKSSPALIEGDYHTLICDDENNVYGFSRNYMNESVIVIVNAGTKEYDASSLINKKDYEEVLKERYITENTDSICASVPVCSVHIYKKRKES